MLGRLQKPGLRNQIVPAHDNGTLYIAHAAAIIVVLSMDVLPLRTSCEADERMKCRGQASDME